jgi:hypothetical protein
MFGKCVVFLQHSKFRKIIKNRNGFGCSTSWFGTRVGPLSSLAHVTQGGGAELKPKSATRRAPFYVAFDQRPYCGGNNNANGTDWITDPISCLTGRTCMWLSAATHTRLCNPRCPIKLPRNCIQGSILHWRGFLCPKSNILAGKVSNRTRYCFREFRLSKGRPWWRPTSSAACKQTKNTVFEKGETILASNRIKSQ